MRSRKGIMVVASCAFIMGLALASTFRHAALAGAEPKVTPETTQPAEPLTEIKIIERVNEATERGLAHLAAKQRPDGGWHNNNAVNALAMLAFLGRGHVPLRGKYPDVLEKGKQYLMKTQRDDGFTSFGTMYEHGLATLALVEMYGMDPDPELELKTRKAVDLILKCQSPQGGWNYNPNPTNGDLSVSVMQIVAMRAANNAEIPVPADNINRAVKYLYDHANPGGGGYGYGGPGAGPQTSAAGTLSMQLLGKHDDPQVAKTLDYLLSFKPTSEQFQLYGTSYFYYYHYYAIQAFYQAGGKHWNEWHPPVRELLLKNQNKDGSWDVPPGSAEVEGTVGPNKVYWTALATLVLDIYQHFLPAYQR